MKALNQFNKFGWEQFSAGKQYAVTQVSDYSDFNTGEHLGTKIEVVIVVDDTVYRTRDGEAFTNRFEKLVFKVNKDINLPLDAMVQPKGVTATIYGEYRNQLSIKCEDVVVIDPTATGNEKNNG